MGTDDREAVVGRWGSVGLMMSQLAECAAAQFLFPGVCGGESLNGKCHVKSCCHCLDSGR
jgi:hypothetical protein